MAVFVQALADSEPVLATIHALKNRAQRRVAGVCVNHFRINGIDSPGVELHVCPAGGSPGRAVVDTLVEFNIRIGEVVLSIAGRENGSRVMRVMNDGQGGGKKTPTPNLPRLAALLGLEFSHSI